MPFEHMNIPVQGKERKKKHKDSHTQDNNNGNEQSVYQLVELKFVLNITYFVWQLYCCVCVCLCVWEK